MSSSDDIRRRRALYRAEHRGTKEMDWLLGRFCAAQLASMPDETLERLEELLALPDPELQAWILSGSGFAGSTLAPLIGEIRAFHGLTGEGG